MKTTAVTMLLALLTTWTCLSQTVADCDTVYAYPTEASYKNGQRGLMDYVSNKIAPILGRCMERDQGLITSFTIAFVVNKAGQVTHVEFPRLAASEACKRELRQEMQKMKGWSPATVNGKAVCSRFTWRVPCLLWQ